MKPKILLTWSAILSKRILKMPIIAVLLIFIPILTVTVRLLPENAASSDITVGLFFEKDDTLTLRMKNLLLSSGDGGFSFVEYDDKSIMEKDVISGMLECAYIFDSDFSNALNNGHYKNTIEVVAVPSAMLLSAINEIVFAAVVRMSGYEVLDKYIHIDGIDDKTASDLGSFMHRSYEAYCAGGETFHLDIRTANNISLNQNTDTDATVTFPLRGLLSILIMLSALTGSIAWLIDREKGLFAPRPLSFCILSCILYPLLPAVLFTLCSELALGISQSAYTPALEVMYSIRYICMVTAFSCACCMLKKSSRVIPLIPAFLIGSLIFCPVFINIEGFLPAFKFISRLFLPRYFL